MTNIIDEFKSKYDEVFEIEILDQKFIFRSLGRTEYATIAIRELDLGEYQEEICKAATLYPFNYNFSIGKAGIAECLSDAIIDATGAHEGQIFDILIDHRMEMQNFDFQLDSIIHEVYPEFPITEIEKWSIRKTLYYYSRAEWVMRNIRGIQTETFFLLDNMIEERLKMLYPEEFEDENTEEQVSDEDGNKNILDEFKIKDEVNSLEKDKEEIDLKEQERQMLALMQQEAASRGMQIGSIQKNLDKNIPESKWFEYEDDLKGNID